MITFDDSEKAINGLAKIIAQDPTFPIRLRNIKDKLLGENVMKIDKLYLKKQEDILRKAEEIGLVSTGYIFSLVVDDEIKDNEGQYMIYRNINNEMVPLISGFKYNPRSYIHSGDLISVIKSSHILSLVTFDPSFQDKFYSFPWFDKGKTEQEDQWGHCAQHMGVYFDRGELQELKDNGISFQNLNQGEAWKFNLNLKQVSSD